MTLLDDLAAHLQTAGVGTVGTDLFKAGLYDGPAGTGGPDDQVAIAEYGGEPPIEVIGGAGLPVLVRPHIQVMARSLSYPTAAAKARAAYDALAGEADTTLNGTRYLRIEALQEPFSLGRDENGRWLVAVNFRVTREK